MHFSGEADGTVTSTVQFWSLDSEDVQALPNENQTVVLLADNQAVDFSEASEAQDTVSGAITEV